MLQVVNTALPAGAVSAMVPLAAFPAMLLAHNCSIQRVLLLLLLCWWLRV
jgi:hypothetical protein